MRSTLALLLSVAAALLFVCPACSERTPDRPSAPGTEPPPAAAAPSPLADAPLEGFRIDLLDLAFRAVTAMPVDPHIKNRSRAQEEVVAACLELDQPGRALEYIEKIDNWRRGAGYADLAYHCAGRGDTGAALAYLDLAEQVADAPPDELFQEWRRDRIRAKIARTLLLLGRPDEAAPFEADLVDSESGAVQCLKAGLAGPEGFDAQMAAAESALASGTFELMQNGLGVCAELFNRFYDDEASRARAEEKMKSSWGKMPVLVRVEHLLALAGYALDHEDCAKALELLNESGAIVEEANWLPEDRIRLLARLAALRHRAGDGKEARAEADAALALFRSDRDEIVNIYRAGALRPLAETFHAMGDPGVARSVYSLAVEEGVENPNSRPRAEDLAATCCSMALHGFDPGEILWARMLQICESLGDPW